MADVKNFSYSGVVSAPVPALSGTTIGVAPGHGALFALNRPAVIYPLAQFPRADNAEIVMVTAIVGDTLNITRAIEGTTPRAVQLGDQIAQVLTAAMWNDLLVGTVVSSITGAPGEIIVSTPTGDVVLSLPSVNPTPGTFGAASLVPVITVDAKGRITSITTAPLTVGALIDAGDLTGSTLAPNVTNAALDHITPASGTLLVTGNITGDNLSGTNTGDNAPNTTAAADATAKANAAQAAAIAAAATDATTKANAAQSNAITAAALDATAKANAAQAASQPLDSDLTAIAALATVPFGRGFLTLADQAAAQAYIGALAGGPANAETLTGAFINPTVLTASFNNLTPVSGILSLAATRILNPDSASFIIYGATDGAARFIAMGSTHATLPGQAFIDGVTFITHRINAATVGVWSPTGLSVTGKVVASASSPTRASFNAPHGTAPAAPVDGDLWSTASGFFGRVNGVTVPLTGGGGGGAVDAGTLTGATLAANVVNASLNNITPAGGTLSLNGVTNVTASTASIGLTSTVGTQQVLISFNSTGGTYYLGADNSAGNAFGFGAYDFGVFLPAGRTFATLIGGVGIVTRISGAGLAVTGAITATGAITGSNLSGTHTGNSSGTNTGDQNLSGYAPLTGAGASGTWAINVTGSSGSANSLTSTAWTQRNSWNGSQTEQIDTATGGLGALEVQSNGAAGLPAFMCFHRASAYATYFGLDTDNQFTFGGWSAGAAKYKFLTQLNYTTYVPTLTGAGASGTWGINITGNAATITNQANSATITAAVAATANTIVLRDGSGNANVTGFAVSGDLSVLGTTYLHNTVDGVSLRLRGASKAVTFTHNPSGTFMDSTDQTGVATWQPLFLGASFQGFYINTAQAGYFDSGGFAVTGSLSKGSGTFRIDHPLPAKKATHYLVHSFIEGARPDLIYRGTAQLAAGTVTIDLDVAIGWTAGTWDLLCRDPMAFAQNVSGFSPLRASIAGHILTITSLANQPFTVNWMVVAERQDAVIKAADWTDLDGRTVLEPEKVVDVVTGLPRPFRTVKPIIP